VNRRTTESTARQPGHQSSFLSALVRHVRQDPHALVLLLVFAFVFSWYFAEYHRRGWVIGSDGLSYYAYLRSFALDRDLDFSNEFKFHNPLGHAVPDPDLKTSTGMVPNLHSVGPAILWAPFFLVAHALSTVLAHFNPKYAPDGYTPLYHLFIGFGTVLYTCVAVALLYRFLSRYYPKSVSLTALLALWFGSNLIYYTVIEPAMPHALSLFAVVLFLCFLSRAADKPSIRNFALTGMAAGLMVLARWQSVIYLLLVGLLALREALPAGRSGPWNVRGLFSPKYLALVVCLLAVALIQAVAWKVIYGSFLIIPQGREFLRWNNPELAAVLFSLRRGLFTWHPILLISTIGLWYAIGVNAPLALSFSLVLLGQIYINAVPVDWWAGVSFGMRRFVECFPVFAFGLAAVCHRASSIGIIKRSLGICLVCFVAWNWLVMTQFASDQIEADADLSVRRVLYNAVYGSGIDPELRRIRAAEGNGNWEKVFELAQEALRTQQSHDYYYYLGLYHCRRGDSAAGLAMFERAGELEPWRTASLLQGRRCGGWSGGRSADETLRGYDDPPHRIGVVFGNVIKFIGYGRADTLDTTASTLCLTYYWQGVAEMDRDYGIFVHFLAGRRIVRGDDHLPLDGRLPTTRWMKGEYVKEHRCVVIPAPGEKSRITVRIGVEEWRSHSRLRVTSGGKSSNAHSLTLDEG
jgi:Dolichyl-phosphate-mannose-protein mannosyltransferase